MSSLAAARADNFYYPPEWTPEQGGLNKFQGQHPLRERAKKIGEGILVIRFEMPFNVWCKGCRHLIGKGVRFNAEKKAIGNYHSTKIWSFKMKSACCQTEIEIHTDPKNTEYVVVNGAERKVEEYDAEDAGTVELPSKEDREQLADPFFHLEHGNEDRRKGSAARNEILQLRAASDRKHTDPYARNRELRARLRAQKKRVATEEADSRQRGLGIRLLPASAEDAEAAACVRFGKGRAGFEESKRKARAAVKASPIFPAEPVVPTNAANSRAKRPPPALEKAERRRELLAKRLRIQAHAATALVSSGYANSSKSRPGGGHAAASVGPAKVRQGFG